MRGFPNNANKMVQTEQDFKLRTPAFYLDTGRNQFAIHKYT